MGHRSLRTRALSAVLVLGAAVSLGSIASGAVTRVVIYACVDREAHLTQIGTDRLDCGDDSLITWNQQGVPGAPGATGADGAPGLRWRSLWDESATYDEGDAVSFKGGVYIALRGDLQGEAPKDSEAWDVLSERGESGKDGAPGPAGARGPTGRPGATGLKGPKGDTGPQGIEGAQGVQGVAGPAGAGLTGWSFASQNFKVAGPANSVSAAVDCPAGHGVTGGGYRFLGSGVERLYVVTNNPYAGSLSGWHVEVFENNPNSTDAWEVKVWAICAKLP